MSFPKYFFIVFTVLLLLPAATFADTILLQSDIWCPYNCAPDAKRPGYAIEISERILHKAGHTLTYETAPWSRALKLVKDGDISAIIGVTKNEAPALVFPEQEIGISLIHFFKRKGYPWNFAGTESLRDVNVGIMGDYEYGAELDAYFEKNKGTNRVQVIKSKTPLVLNIKKLLEGRIDVVPEDKAAFIETARSMGVLDRIEDAGVDPITSKAGLDESLVYIAFSPKDPKSMEYARLISEGIEQMRASGELSRILAKYELRDWREEYKGAIKKYQ
ncbi:MAG: transporter substrate-binding domain-containing protein [Deltaproteobacteria bacterium]|nr:transporter substrate-binding domain-containing protein [Deltaproteobacteria bacterium]